MIESNELFPKNLLVDEIAPQLSVLQIEMIKEQNFYKSSSDYRKIADKEKHLSLSSIDILENEFEILDDLSLYSDNFIIKHKIIETNCFLIKDFAEFCKRLDQIEVRIDLDTTERLFKALTLEESPSIYQRRHFQYFHYFHNFFYRTGHDYV